MTSRAKFFGGAAFVTLGVGITSYLLPPRDAGGSLWWSFSVTESTVAILLPWTAVDVGVPASYARIQRNVGDRQYMIHNAGSNTLSVRRSDNVAVVSITSGQCAMFGLVDLAPSAVGFWIYEKRTLL